MNIQELKSVFAKLWEAKSIIAGTMIVTGVLDLIGITSKEIGLGFILGLLLVIALGLSQFAKKSPKKQ